jgi:hypothetical protein
MIDELRFFSSRLCFDEFVTVLLQNETLVCSINNQFEIAISQLYNILVLILEYVFHMIIINKIAKTQTTEY